MTGALLARGFQAGGIVRFAGQGRATPVRRRMDDGKAVDQGESVCYRRPLSAPWKAEDAE